MTSLITTDLVRLGADWGSDKHDVIRALARMVADGGRSDDPDQLAADAITRERRQSAPNDRAQGAVQSGSEPKGQELEYAARISLERASMQVEDKLVNLGPGMAVTVEIKTGARRIISFLLSPLARYKHESLRER